jgi:3-deoxy-D-manno-octulosonate cytidylyltransferase
VIITSRKSGAVAHRAAELGIDEVHQGVADKMAKVGAIAGRFGVGIQDAVYFGDDLTDLPAMRTVGTACCPADAAREVKQECTYISPYDGGDGAVRDMLGYVESSTETVLGVIPARYGSTRLPGKPLVEIAGKPMIERVYERASRARLLDELVVATDDQRIVEAVEAFGGTAMMTDTAHESGTDRVAEVAADREAGFVVNIQGDEPLIEPQVIDDVITALRERTAKVATPITPVRDASSLGDENTVKVVTDRSGKALYFSRSVIPSERRGVTVYKHVGMYGYDRELLLEYVGMDSRLEAAEDLEQLRLLENGYDIQTIMTTYESVEVNISEDVNRVESILKRDTSDETQ